MQTLIGRLQQQKHSVWATSLHTSPRQRPCSHIVQQQYRRRPLLCVTTRTIQLSEAEIERHKDPGPEAKPHVSSEQFSWTKAWYPAAAIENLDSDKPNKFMLLGRDYVLWADAAGQWHCFRDRCPHRLATLSDGFVDRQRGEIVCAYHGWRFQVREVDS
eukprot:GHRR01011192.1.p1 GENE.GHRR01011192.1~~GHRR01011192.1.p1  ORF type:complete len:159 (+),score=41.42 GHRR01011192.1:376-852(+)